MSLTLFLSCATNKLVSYISLLLWNTMVKISLFTFYDRPFYISKKKSIIFDCFFHYKIPFLFFINSNLDIEWFHFVYNIQFYHILPILDFLLPDSKRTGGTYLL